MAQDGLRYVAKKAGSPFTASRTGIGATMSCFRCGAHRLASDLDTKRFLGRNERVCRGGCLQR